VSNFDAIFPLIYTGYMPSEAAQKYLDSFNRPIIEALESEGITEQQARDAATRLNYIGTREAEIVAEIGRLESEKSQLTRIILAYQSQEAKKEKESKKEDKKQ